MKIYLAGYQASTDERETRLIKAGVVKYRCVSFANVVKIPGFPYYVSGIDEGYQACLREGVGIMFDSGVFSYRRYRRRCQNLGDTKALKLLPDNDEFIRLYIKYCKKYIDKFDFAVTTDLDWNGADNFKRHVYLEKMGLRTNPVFHGDQDSGMHFLKEYADRGYKYICIGTGPLIRSNNKQKRQYLSAVFNEGAKLGVEFHGLALTSPWMLLEFPWRSCDSSSWSRAAGYGCVIRFNEVTQRMAQFHVSDRVSAISKYYHGNTAVLKHLKREIESEGFDFHEIQTNHTERHLYNAKTMLAMATAADRKQKGRWRPLV